jgi:hypothetical protein
MIVDAHILVYLRQMQQKQQKTIISEIAKRFEAYFVRSTVYSRENISF